MGLDFSHYADEMKDEKVSSVEVLRKMINAMAFSDSWEITVERSGAIGNVLLALERIDKLDKHMEEMEKSKEGTFEGALYGSIIGTCKVREILGIEKKELV